MPAVHINKILLRSTIILKIYKGFLRPRSSRVTLTEPQEKVKGSNKKMGKTQQVIKKKTQLYNEHVKK